MAMAMAKASYILISRTVTLLFRLRRIIELTPDPGLASYLVIPTYLGTVHTLLQKGKYFLLSLPLFFFFLIIDVRQATAHDHLNGTELRRNSMA